MWCDGVIQLDIPEESKHQITGALENERTLAGVVLSYTSSKEIVDRYTGNVIVRASKRLITDIRFEDGKQVSERTRASIEGLLWDAQEIESLGVGRQRVTWVEL